MSFWLKLNHLVPEPNCDTRGNEITEWRDARPQPTAEAIEAVDETAALAKYKEGDFDREVEALPPIMKAIFEELDQANPGFRGRAKARHGTGA